MKIGDARWRSRLAEFFLSISPSFSHSLKLSTGYLVVEAIDYSVFSCLLIESKKSVRGFISLIAPYLCIITQYCERCGRVDFVLHTLQDLIETASLDCLCSSKFPLCVSVTPRCLSSLAISRKLPSSVIAQIIF